MTEKLEEMDHICQSQKDGENPEVMELNITENGEFSANTDQADKNAVRLRKSEDSEGHSDTSSDKNTDISSDDNGEMALHSIMSSINQIQPNYKKNFVNS